MPHAPSHSLSRRHAAVRRALSEHSLDALVVTARPNIAYLTNFSGSTAILVVTADDIHFLTDSRYETTMRDAAQTAWACPGLELHVVVGAYDPALAALMLARGWRRVGFEAAQLTVARHRGLTAAIGDGIDLIATEDIVEAARVVKDDYEIATLREAGRRLSGVVPAAVDLVRVGAEERVVAALIDLKIREAGFSASAFETIVASGPHSALPHARPTERKFVEGDLVVLDFGGVYDSYCVDLTRTVVLGPASQRVGQVYNAVREAHDRAIGAVAPGASRFAIDAAARDFLAAAGMGDAFGHGTGHGLGIEVHEDPRIVRRRQDIDVRHEFITAGMVFTIEPGAYFPGWGGVRIEDDVLVTDAGGELLTDATTELLVVD